MIIKTDCGHLKYYKSRPHMYTIDKRQELSPRKFRDPISFTRDDRLHSGESEKKPPNKFSRIIQRIDSNKIRYLDQINYTPSARYIGTVDWTKVKPMRSGVIVYTVINGTLVFLLGQDAKSGDLTDFGGGIRFKKDSNSVQGGLREFMEESLCVMGWINEQDVQKCVTVYSTSMMIIFLHLDLDIVSVTQLFHDRVKFIKNPEISTFVWLTQDEFRDLIGPGLGSYRLYARVRKLLSRAGDFYKLL